MRPVCRLASCLTAAAIAVTSVTVASPTVQASHNGQRHSDTSQVSAVVAELAEANQQLADIGALIQGQQEGVNKALLEVSQARDTAAAARRDAERSQQHLAEATAAIDAAQRRFNQFAAASYVNGPPKALIVAASPDDIVAAASAEQTLSIGYRNALTDLHRARTEKTNQDSLARAAQQHADQALADAQRRQDAAVAALTEAQRQFGAQQAEIDRLVAARASAQSRLDATRPAATINANWDRLPVDPPAPRSEASQWDTTLPMVPSANVAGDPIAIINSVLQISATSAQLTADMGRKFLAGLGIVPQAAASADPGFTNGRIPRVYGRQASEYVIRRAMSQLGVPYSWGGGNANGPSRGIDQGANTVGFDCSGLILYAFAGVGIKLDHYSGFQYNAGRKVPSSQMRRGDLIFYGPNASQHEAMYLGNGQMIEAPFTGSQVRIAPVRTSGMMPYVTRLIEY
ncbi:NlpC/P60 family peptidoglycan endopeptidase RipA [Mycolicibacterium goodii]|uniref:NlpC/P60 family peptidoglycan endopeptidase RipA n=1 Tax=Mycolicibacterium goodii TaxID=134601 RepID=A0ABS6HMI8_MYCGD|nr:NlpC/P60 family peptidoglycan endopeptidase RipA [Mycolicibacterium goodii]MBU8822770.1 NlpC/P60 family peptidoglycan endopeptidase RipA [Mycolicibacterium goodii]MBU8838864.1 NlpC/P60 family peptidoglycan endopeptidase RipA [Mycolicibacterium goodii]